MEKKIQACLKKLTEWREMQKEAQLGSKEKLFAVVEGLDPLHDL